MKESIIERIRETKPGETICLNLEECGDVLELLKGEYPKKGHWIEQEGFDGDSYYDCSVCGESWMLIDGTPKDNGMIYCPHCGARMYEPPKEGES